MDNEFWDRLNSFPRNAAQMERQAEESQKVQPTLHHPECSRSWQTHAWSSLLAADHTLCGLEQEHSDFDIVHQLILVEIFTGNNERVPCFWRKISQANLKKLSLISPWWKVTALQSTRQACRNILANVLQTIQQFLRFWKKKRSWCSDAAISLSHSPSPLMEIYYLLPSSRTSSTVKSNTLLHWDIDLEKCLLQSLRTGHWTYWYSWYKL